MIRINLLPIELEKKAIAQRRTVLAVAAGVFVIVIFVGIYLMRVAKITALKAELKNTERELKRYDADLKKIQRIEAQKNELLNKLNVIKQLVSARLDYPKLMEFMTTSDFLPQRVWLTSAQMKSDASGISLTLNLQARDNYAIADFLQNLEKNSHISKVVIKGFASQGGSESGEKIRTFSITCLYNPRVDEKGKKKNG